MVNGLRSLVPLAKRDGLPGIAVGTLRSFVYPQFNALRLDAARWSLPAKALVG
jgi:hypothetical protein